LKGLEKIGQVDILKSGKEGDEAKKAQWERAILDRKHALQGDSALKNSAFESFFRDFYLFQTLACKVV
jgi:hypothetical protein